MVNWPLLIFAMIGLGCLAWLVLMLCVYFGTRKLSSLLRASARSMLVEAEGLEARSKRVEELADSVAGLEVRS